MPVILWPWEILANWANVEHQLISAAIMLNDLLGFCNSVKESLRRNLSNFYLFIQEFYSPSFISNYGSQEDSLVCDYEHGV